MINKKINLLFCYVLLAVVLHSCSMPKQQEKPKFKYSIQYTLGNRIINDVSTGDIIYLDDGKIKFESYNNGHPDTLTIGGTYVIQKYR
jgi:pyruvate kinase